MDAISEASFQMCTRKPKSPKACKWFDKDTKEALKQMHKDRQRARIYPSPHNILRAQTSNKQYKYQIKRAKRSHAMAYASTVNTTTDLWALNKWYRGIRKSIMPALKERIYHGHPTPRQKQTSCRKRGSQTCTSTSTYPSPTTPSPDLFFRLLMKKSDWRSKTCQTHRPLAYPVSVTKFLNGLLKQTPDMNLTMHSKTPSPISSKDQ